MEQGDGKDQREALAAGSQNPRRYTCAECGRSYSMYQALGGHVTGHSRRRGNSKREKLYQCRECFAVFSTGQQLGGHMTMHRKRNLSKPKKKQPFQLRQPKLGLSSEADVQLPEPAVERVQPAPAPAPAEGNVEAVPPATGRLRLFGFDIWLSVKTDEEAQDA